MLPWWPACLSRLPQTESWLSCFAWSSFHAEQSIRKEADVWKPEAQNSCLSLWTMPRGGTVQTQLCQMQLWWRIRLVPEKCHLCRLKWILVRSKVAYQSTDWRNPASLKIDFKPIVLFLSVCLSVFLPCKWAYNSPSRQEHQQSSSGSFEEIFVWLEMPHRVTAFWQLCMPITWEYIGHRKCNPWHSSVFLSGCLIRNHTIAALFWLRGTTAELCGLEKASEVAQNLTLGRVGNTGLGLCGDVPSHVPSTPSPPARALSWCCRPGLVCAPGKETAAALWGPQNPEGLCASSSTFFRLQ